MVSAPFPCPKSPVVTSPRTSPKAFARPERFNERVGRVTGTFGRESTCSSSSLKPCCGEMNVVSMRRKEPTCTLQGFEGGIGPKTSHIWWRIPWRMALRLESSSSRGSSSTLAPGCTGPLPRVRCVGAESGNAGVESKRPFVLTNQNWGECPRHRYTLPHPNTPFMEYIYICAYIEPPTTLA